MCVAPPLILTISRLHIGPHPPCQSCHFLVMDLRKIILPLSSYGLTENYCVLSESHKCVFLCMILTISQLYIGPCPPCQSCHFLVMDLQKIIVYSWSTINVYFLFSHEWWVPLIKFLWDSPFMWENGLLIYNTMRVTNNFIFHH